ncbi:PHB depolymerase family esterase [Erythrobacter sp. QSSC1-22B]|uniref:extracellular catalytic domain type 1 short-chain-length polyhydroxyalkanoate depolymerase n=1 Tax=Erythrobacter sp. QSSC1-22B TaxID=1860125 RepID=UPI0018F88D61|nr:PHB depolymerase family esterase [Erythrobacter sp. QSSC1-22B]
MMIHPMNAQMKHILALTRAGSLSDATALIQRTLSATNFVKAEPSLMPARPVDLRKEMSALPKSQAIVRKGKRNGPRDGAAQGMKRHCYDAARGSLDYLLYVPAQVDGPLPLVIMLHGCTQSADDFARGTHMNEIGKEFGLIVAYPEQRQSANAQKCWNWFRPGDQKKGAGEPEMIAGITREIMANCDVDSSRVYIAGLSAGGAAAAIMAASYPELYTAVGIHSGLACGSARDLPSALAAMRGQRKSRPVSASPYIPVITFHGDRDSTVHPANSEQIHADCASSPDLASLERRVEQGVSSAGRRYRKTSLVNSDCRSLAENWEIVGAGHAWSGGSPAGSYTDASGPDASREMARFFLQHRKCR